MQERHSVRRAGVADANVIAEMLDDFNREFDTPTPGISAIADRLVQLLAGDDVVVLLTGEPAAGVAVLTFRPSLWHNGPTALLEELYVRPSLRNRRYGHALLESACALAKERGAQELQINVDGEDIDARRFYEAHGFRNIEPGAEQPMYYYYRELS